METKSIAVMPFASLSPDLDNEYFCEGITDDLISALAKLDDLRVISRTSAFHLKETTADIAVIAYELGVSHLLEGSIRQSGDQLRITAQLVKAPEDNLLWGEQYDVELLDIFDVQDHITNEIVAALEIEFSDADHVFGDQLGIDFESYNLYLKGRFHWNKRTERDFELAKACFEKALKISPNFARAYAGLADVYTFQVNWGYLTLDEGLPKARSHAKRALDINEQSYDAHLAMERIVRNYDWDWSAVEYHAKRALELNQGYVRAHEVYADYLRIIGDADSAINQMNQALRLDPLNAIAHSAQARNYAHARRYSEALNAIELALEIAPELAHARYFQGEILVHMKEYEKAQACFEHVAFDLLQNFGALIALSGQSKTEEAASHLENLLSNTGDQAAYQIALGHFHLGKIDEGFEWLNKAYELRDGGLTNLKVDPLADPIREDPRYQQMLEKIGLS